MKNEISSTFLNEDRNALDALERKREDLTRARELSPALVSLLDLEIAASETALEKARDTGREYDLESAELARATARRQQAVTTLNTSHEVDPDAADRIVRDAERAKYLEGAYRRRADAARDAATSKYARASKEIAARNHAVRFAELLAGAVVDRDAQRIPTEKRPDVIAWLPLVFAAEGRAAYLISYDFRKDHPSYPVPPTLEEYEAACERFFESIERTRAEAAKLAADLGALT